MFLSEAAIDVKKLVNKKVGEYFLTNNFYPLFITNVRHEIKIDFCSKVMHNFGYK